MLVLAEIHTSLPNAAGMSRQGIGFACEIMSYSYQSSGMSTALAVMAKIGVPASS